MTTTEQTPRESTAELIAEARGLEDGTHYVGIRPADWPAECALMVQSDKAPQLARTLRAARPILERTPNPAPDFVLRGEADCLIDTGSVPHGRTLVLSVTREPDGGAAWLHLEVSYRPGEDRPPLSLLVPLDEAPALAEKIEHAAADAWSCCLNPRGGTLPHPSRPAANRAARRARPAGRRGGRRG